MATTSDVSLMSEMKGQPLYKGFCFVVANLSDNSCTFSIKPKFEFKMEAGARTPELLRTNTSLRAKHTRMMEQLLFYHREVAKLAWRDDTTRLFDQVLLRYKEAPPPVHVDAPPQAQIMELLGRNNSDLWAINQSLSRDLRLLESRFEDLMIQKTCDAQTMTEDEADEQEEKLQMLEAEVKALRLEIYILKEEKLKTEERQQCVEEESCILQKVVQALQKDTDRMGADIRDKLKISTEKPTFPQQRQALTEQVAHLHARKSQLENSLQKLEASARPHHRLRGMWRKLFEK